MIDKLKTTAECEAGIEAIDALMDVAEPGTILGYILDTLSAVVGEYEREHWPTGLPDALTAIQFRMEQQGLKQADVYHCFGSRSKCSEVLSGKRTLSLMMIRRLHNELGIPLESLIQERKVINDD